MYLVYKISGPHKNDISLIDLSTLPIFLGFQVITGDHQIILIDPDLPQTPIVIRLNKPFTIQLGKNKFTGQLFNDYKRANNVLRFIKLINNFVFWRQLQTSAS
ncbi:hypothetical protein A2533_03100 [Candidatus Falkowbacteria bacterium RIFOXYD2_FULL_35_9]|uniref:Uncharacterized protein n=1 Tax=Candidatus Falkowbacteria bacterium RIFOXYC2_FULL_36_12 TaxID=1798002 RepID=A0A1F5SW97_9BACT|nr:MAG: hypothetical protein A2478_00355 [Candidatus Falkowbacteria bacterium RIFOXYC2_FULL_36_12]OGF31560.1 MAG: hypothetical protein A2300_03715 [Candidatus Falkowbacteria bacterium RIFOXYB2_FULL_35_7]OGF33591.1 MAG: hypothetical protein A2223_03490 [Candidatus Falkowbacteria bacterium RIFOXYA2_FULL_35_8]OGF46960.1 MAG: hypothetical protein A2533_03100 [Candidatus Falkowbacteria bacterium RIFOXYD2_FULL_35_9]